MYAVCAVPKATPEEKSILEQLVHAVRLENTTRYHSEAPVPKCISPLLHVPFPFDAHSNVFQVRQSCD